MELRVFRYFCLISMVSATAVDIRNSWKDNFGWVITCSWQLYSNDSLQSVRLYKEDQQFMIYRPENNGWQRHELFSLPDKVAQVECTKNDEAGVLGKCVISLELYQPQKEDFKYGCEVSGERPFFRMEKKEILVPALVPPSAANIDVIETHPSGRVNLNCSSTGVPSPNLIWTIGDQREPQTFSSSYWNMTSKLWHTWASITFIPTEAHSAKAVCTPEVTKSNKSYTGAYKVYHSSANGIDASGLVLSVIYCLILLR